jgi:hypothetical protein
MMDSKCIASGTGLLSSIITLSMDCRHENSSYIIILASTRWNYWDSKAMLGVASSHSTSDSFHTICHTGGGTGQGRVFSISSSLSNLQRASAGICGHRAHSILATSEKIDLRP